MLGGTHLAFGTALSLTVVGLAHLGLGATVPIHHLSLHWAGRGDLALPDLHPTAWLALALAGSLGSVLPDIDQPGSLVTRLPTREGRALQKATRPYSQGAIGAPTRLTVDTLAAGGNLATALLGGNPRRHPARRNAWLVLAVLFAALALVARWLPSAELLSWPEPARHSLALALVAIAGAALLLAFGGLAGLIHRLPGHHRGWTHAPPVALTLSVAAWIAGPQLVPALPGVGPAFALGYCSHLAADALTIRGIPLWWPGRQQPSLHLLPRPIRVRTGSLGETLFNICWIAAVPTTILLAAR